MRGPRSRSSLAAGVAHAALVPVAAVAVHELRYVLAFGGSTQTVLTRHGHAYLHSLAPWIAALAALAVGGFLRAVGRALHGEARTARGHAFSLGGLWLLTAVLLVALYAAQEGLEGVFAAGHPAGLAGIFGHGGVWAIPAAVCVGLVLAAALQGARRVLEAVAARHAAAAAARRKAAPRRSTPHPARPRLAPVAAGWSDRGPPATV